MFILKAVSYFENNSIQATETFEIFSYHVTYGYENDSDVPTSYTIEYSHMLTRSNDSTHNNSTMIVDRHDRNWGEIVIEDANGKIVSEYRIEKADMENVSV